MRQRSYSRTRGSFPWDWPGRLGGGRKRLRNRANQKGRVANRSFKRGATRTIHFVKRAISAHFDNLASIIAHVALWTEYKDLIELGIRDVDGARLVHGDADWSHHLSSGTNLVDWLTARIEMDDAVTARVG